MLLAKNSDHLTGAKMKIIGINSVTQRSAKKISEAINRFKLKITSLN
jgi:hypothetical protein